MCTVNHVGSCRPGYLIDVPVESMASLGVLYSRMLSHHREVGLSCEQIMGLLDLNREYHDRQVAIQLEFANVTEALEIKWGRINAMEVEKREELLKKHAQLFEAHERLFFEMAQRGHEHGHRIGANRRGRPGGRVQQTGGQSRTVCSRRSHQVRQAVSRNADQGQRQAGHRGRRAAVG